MSTFDFRVWCGASEIESHFDCCTNDHIPLYCVSGFCCCWLLSLHPWSIWRLLWRWLRSRLLHHFMFCQAEISSISPLLWHFLQFLWCSILRVPEQLWPTCAGSVSWFSVSWVRVYFLSALMNVFLAIFIWRFLICLSSSKSFLVFLTEVMSTLVN
jgi:hypothetical protein